MNKKWMFVQIAIATVLFAWALFFLYSFTDRVVAKLSGAVNNGVLASGEISYTKLIGLYNVNYLCGILAGYGGLALLFEKKGGWVASMAASLVYMGFMLVAARNGMVSGAGTKSSHAAPSYLIAGLIFATIFVLLASRPFRQKYQANWRNWLVVAGIILVVVIDRNIFVP